MKTCKNCNTPLNNDICTNCKPNTSTLKKNTIYSVQTDNTKKSTPNNITIPDNNVASSIVEYAPNTSIEPTSHTTKNKKTKRTITASFLLACVLFLFAYFLIHSEISMPRSTTAEHESFLITELINRMKVNDNDFEIHISSEEVAHFLSQKINLNEISLLGYQPLYLYFHKDLSKYIIPLRSPLGKTTLLLESDIQVEKDILKFRFKNPRVGKFQIPIPTFLFSHSNLEWIIPSEALPFAKITSVNQSEKSVSLKGTLNKNYILERVQVIKQSINPDFAYFLESSQKKFLPAYLDFQALDNNSSIGETLKSFTNDTSNLINWFYIIPDNIFESEIISVLSKLLTIEENNYLEDLLKQSSSSKQKLESDYITYAEKELKNRIINSANITFQSLANLHINNGVPAYYLASHGNVYSQTLQKYITLEELFPYTNESEQFNLYANGTDILFGKIVGKDFWYVEESNPYELTIHNHELLLKELNYTPLETLPNNSTPILVERGNAERSSIAKIVSKYLNCMDSIFVNYLSISGNDGFLIATPDTDLQSSFQFLLKKENGVWQIIKAMSEIDNVRIELEQEIRDQSFDVRILPPYEITDFKRDYLNQSDLELMPNFLYYDDIFGYSFREVLDKSINYYSAVNSNLYITYDAEHKYLINRLHKIIVPKDKKTRNYFSYLIPHSEHPKYYPTFLFYQD